MGHSGDELDHQVELLRAGGELGHEPTQHPKGMHLPEGEQEPHTSRSSSDSFNTPGNAALNFQRKRERRKASFRIVHGLVVSIGSFQIQENQFLCFHQVLVLARSLHCCSERNLRFV